MDTICGVFTKRRDVQSQWFWNENLPVKWVIVRLCCVFIRILGCISALYGYRWGFYSLTLTESFHQQQKALSVCSSDLLWSLETKGSTVQAVISKKLLKRLFWFYVVHPSPLTPCCWFRSLQFPLTINNELHTFTLLSSTVLISPTT